METALAGHRVTIRALDAADGEAVLAQRVRNRAYLAPWEPLRDASWGTAEAVRADLTHTAEQWRLGTGFHFAIVHEGELAGRVALNNVVRGTFQNAYLGYFVDEAGAGRGFATEAVQLAVRFAFDEAGLHRVQAAVMPRNGASIRVLEKAGFRREGLALRYLKIAGAWEDHLLFTVGNDVE